MPPLTPSRDLNLEDLELLHQYVTSTLVPTAQLAPVTARRQAVIPQIAQEHPFVMHGILAQAAVHLSWLRGRARRPHYALLALRHHSVALPAFSAALRHGLSEANHRALALFAKGLVWCAFAWFQPGGCGAPADTSGFAAPTRPPNFASVFSEASSSPTPASSVSPSTGRPTDCDPPPPLLQLPVWFRLLRGACLLAESSRPWMGNNGLHLTPPSLDDDAMRALSATSESRRILGLRDNLALLSDGGGRGRSGAVGSGDNASSCSFSPTSAAATREAVLDGLYQAFALASMRHHNTPLRNALNYWMGVIPNEYLEALERRTEPWALVVLAYFCVLVARSETQWFMRNHAACLLHSIRESLPGPWSHAIQWPCEEVGLHLYTAPPTMPAPT